jgi:hypothetical protein
VAYLHRAKSVTLKHVPAITATVDEVVLSPSQAELCRAVTSRASFPLVCCQATAINIWIMQEWGGFTWPHKQWRHAFQQWLNNWSTGGRSVSRVSDQGFIGEPEARLQAVLGSRQLWKVRSWRRSDRVNWRLEDFKCEWKTFFVCNIWSDLKR